ncbi:cercosporin resistance [Apiospora sp. TS-2023a]
MRLFPFVIVPSHMSAAQLRSERPVLWKAVMLQACFLEGGRQVYMGRKLLQELSEALLTKPRKGLDVLQGLLLYIGWFHYALTTFQVTNLLGLARSLCTSLGFNENKTEMEPQGYGSEKLDQMRAFAGTYYLSTYTFLTSKRPDALGNTAYLQVVSRIIEAKNEYPTDAMLVRLLEIQQISHSISLAFVDGSNGLMSPRFSALPLIMIVKGFQAQIENFKSKLPTKYLVENGKSRFSSIPCQTPLIAHAQVAEILLYEVGMQESSCETVKLSCIDRIELLWSLFNTCKAFLALRLQSTPQFEPRFLCIASYDFMYAFITCLKLTNLNDVPGWDLGHVRRDLRLGDLIDQLTGQMQSVIERREKGGFHFWSPEEDPYRRLIDLLHGLRGLLATVDSTTTTRPQPPHQERGQQKQQQQQQRNQQDEDRAMEDIVQIPTPSSQDTVRQSSFNEPFGVMAAAVATGSETGEDVGNGDVMQTWEEAWSDMVFSVDDWGQSTSYAHDPPLPFGFLPS